MMHVRSDILGTGPGREQEAERIKQHQENMKQYYSFWSSLRPLVRGDEIITMFPALKVGNTVDGKSFVVDIIERLKLAQANGQISTREEALSMIQQMRGGIMDKYGKPKSATASWFSHLKTASKGRTLFVYGILKRGFQGHDRLGMDKARFVGEATVRCAQLYDLGKYPCMILTDDPNDVVHGELYEVDDELFEEIKEFERSSGYEDGEVEVGDHGKTATAFIFEDEPDAPLVKGGNWQREDDSKV
jgi:gamma-glutamylcyclotransferase (GGCT)/AIG2-like uncharacterized protein YtfP